MNQVVILFTKDEWEAASEEDRTYISEIISDKYGFNITHINSKEDEDDRQEER